MRRGLISRQYHPDGLDMGLVYRYAPSAFAEQAHHQVSPQYRFISTKRVLQALLQVGFQVVGASQSSVKDIGREPFTKHQLRLRLPPNPNWTVGDVFPELLLMNAHDRSGAFELLLAFWRYWCGNGCAAKIADIGSSIRIRHAGEVSGVVDAALYIASQSHRLNTILTEWQSILLTANQQHQFADQAASIRWKGGAPIPSEDLLTVQRPQDAGDDLFHVYQRVEENLIQGGLPGLSRTVNPKTGARRKLVTRSVQSVLTDTKINTQLWTLAESFAQAA